MYQSLSIEDIDKIAEKTAAVVIGQIQNLFTNQFFEQPLNNTDIQNLFRNRNGEPITDKTLSEWKKKFGMPYHKIGREIYYLISELKQWFSAHKLPLHSSQQRQLFSSAQSKYHIKRGLPTPKRKGVRK